MEGSRAGVGEAPLALGKKPEEIHVLLVDDEKLSRVVVGNLLRKCQYQVTVASSGLEALDILRKHEKGTFHLILTDVMMPDVDGIELLKHVRSDEAFNSMPVVMMSANEHTETVFECIRRGAEDYLLKPVTKKEVQYICQHVWRRQKHGALNVQLLGADEAEDTLQLEPESSSQQFAPVPSRSRESRHHSRERWRVEDQERPRPPPAAAAQEAAAALLSDRLRSGANASSSGRQPAANGAAANGVTANRAATHGHAVNGFAAQTHASPGTAAVGQRIGRTHELTQGARLPLSVYFAQRKTVVNSSDSFRIFCAAVALLQAQHLKGEIVKLRPSRLCLTTNGTLVIGSCSQRQAEIEDKLYASPEELLHKPLTAASDVYSLGVLFFELFNPVMSTKERLQYLSGLRHRILPMELLQSRPQEAAFVLSLLHPDPSSRPTAAKLMQPDCLAPLQRSICKHTAGRAKDAEEVDVHVLLDFLHMMHSNKEAEASHIKSHLDMIDRDIQQVSQRLQELLANDARRRSEEVSSDSSGSGSAVRSSSGARSKRERDTSSDNLAAAAGTTTQGRKSFDVPNADGMDPEERSKWAKIWEDFPILENVYLQRREAQPGVRRQLRADAAARGERVEECNSANGADQLTDFSKDLSMLAKQSKLEVKATLKYGDLMGEGDMVCSAAFDRDDEFFATAGVSKRIKVFEVASVLDEDALLHYPVLEINVNSKISSLCWNSYVKTCLLTADYEGAIQLWDVSANAITSQYEEHSKRVWSVDFSQTDPTRFVSGSDDGTVRLWSMRDAAATATIDSKANVCSVQLSPSNSHLLAFGSANYRAYLYDLRKMAVPLAVIGGHKKALSYVRFMGGDRLVSASTDNTLRLWDINAAAASEGRCDSLMTYSGHTNERNFVGLSVNCNGYIACGSESNEVFTYYHRLPLPLTSHSFAMKGGRRLDADLEGRQFVSTVCWSHKGSNLLAANSAGVIKVMNLTTQ